MTDIAILKQMLKPEAVLPIGKNNYGKNMVRLVEPQCPDSEVTISGIPVDSVVIKADCFKAPDFIFNGKQGECKRADYVIVANMDKKRIVLYIELKRTKNTCQNKEIVQQLKGALCFFRYCREVGKNFWEQPKFLDGYEDRFVCIERSICYSKKKTQPKRISKIHDTPDDMLVVSSPHHLQFHDLTGKA
jgi:hypothetical protein